MGVLQDLVERAWLWQVGPDGKRHPLTCPIDGDYLIPRIKNKRIILVCQRSITLACTYEQRFMPITILQYGPKKRLSTLQFLIRKAELFPGLLSQEELQQGEGLINAAEESEDICSLCQTIGATSPAKAIKDLMYCKFHSRYMLYGQEKD